MKDGKIDKQVWEDALQRSLVTLCSRAAAPSFPSTDTARIDLHFFAEI
jgi:hypothetical protein